jgi:hypothetical protein
MTSRRNPWAQRVRPLTRAALGAVAIALAAGVTSSAQASLIRSQQPYTTILGGTVVPLVSAGSPPDTPALRVDPNQATSPFSGVVSINVRYDGQSFICSGVLVSARDVVTAAHCVDTTGNGQKIDITQAGNDVRAVFNASTVVGDPGRAIVTADSVSMHPNYQGFGNCPYATPTDFCVNDDIAVIHLNQDAPSDAKQYRVFAGPVTTGQVATQVGYGRSGTGELGYTTGPDFRIKRRGENVMDLFDRDDETHFVSGPQEVWYADFDGTLPTGVQDTFCDILGVCTTVLANGDETNIGGGDSGGPSFLLDNGEYLLLGNNTFGGTFSGQIPGAFGTYFGGMLAGAYVDYLETATGGAIDTVGAFDPVPEPGTGALMLAGLGLFTAAVRRRKAT